MKTRVPPIVSLEIAVRMYYEKLEMGSDEIKQLFGEKHSSATFARLKDIARERMHNENVDTYSIYRVNTRVAYASWGLDIADLEMRFNKLKKLSILQPTIIRSSDS
jgi:hypothetical protein